MGAVQTRRKSHYPWTKRWGAGQGADDPYCSTVVGQVFRGNRRAYGPNGAEIDTGDSRARFIYGGGSSLNNPFAPMQTLRPTYGCTRGHNQDVTNLGDAI